MLIGVPLGGVFGLIYCSALMVDISLCSCFMSVMIEMTFAPYPFLISYHAGCVVFSQDTRVMRNAGAFCFFGMKFLKSVLKPLILPLKTNGISSYPSYIIFLVPIVFTPFLSSTGEE